MELLHTLFDGNDVAYTLAVLGLVATLGLGLGNIPLWGIRLGIGGALFAGILFGHFGVEIDPQIGGFVREFGLILFVYTIGLQVGPGFFNALRKDGLALNLMAASLVGMGALIAAGLFVLFDLPLPVTLGLFSGATTNTPSLAAGQQMMKELGLAAEQAALPGLGYAVSYPFGIVGILLAIILLRRLFAIDPAVEAARFEAETRARQPAIETLAIEIRNPNVVGVPVRDIPGISHHEAVLSRVLRDGTQSAVGPDHSFALGDIVLAVGPRRSLEAVRIVLGVESSLDLKAMSSELRWERLVVTSSKVLGRTIAELNLARAAGVTISRLNRAGVELVPSPALALQFGDILTAIGAPAALREVAVLVGNRPQLLQHAQIAPIFIGIVLGILLGSIPIPIPGMAAPLKLGLAGGPLIAAILLSRLGHFHGLVWFMPPNANLVLREIGIVLFLSVVGVRSGARFVETLVEGDGLLWIGCGAVITLLPLVIVGMFARLVLRTNYLTACGLLAGSMTDPPALAFANALHPSEAPALAYATVYPLVMALRVLLAQLLVILLW